MSSFFAQIMEPGGGFVLLPFVRSVIFLLLLLTTTAAIVDFVRIHMIVLSFLSAGLLVSLSFFESEMKRVQSRRSTAGSAPVTNSNASSSDVKSKTKVAPKTD